MWTAQTYSYTIFPEINRSAIIDSYTHKKQGKQVLK